MGHAFSALFADRMARQTHGQFLLRIEDIDQERCQSGYETALIEDLQWLGLDWQRPVRRQSDHFADYAKALESLRDMELLYPCFCSRKEIRAEIRAAGYAPHLAPTGPEGPLYPGTCRLLSKRVQTDRMGAGDPYAIRLKTDDALKRTGPLTWTDQNQGEQQVSMAALGDVVLARKGSPTSYHLSVTVDDHLQNITLVTRGEDLFTATHLHRLLQALLAYKTPSYYHHRLLFDDQGRRFAKRDNAVTLRHLRTSGFTSAEVREMVNDGL